MKRMKRMLCMVAVIALLLTMTTAVSAATLEFANITVSVTHNSTGNEKFDANCVLQKHVKGIADTVSYTVAASNAYRELNTSAINTSYLSYVLAAYDEVPGYYRRVSVPASGTVTIPAVAADGVYNVQASYTYGKATWEVVPKSAGDVEVGVISRAPMSMSMIAVMM